MNLHELIARLHANDPDAPDLQFQAAIELGRIAGESDESDRETIVLELMSALESNHQALTRAHAAQELGKLKSVAAVDRLLDALKDPYQLVRSYAAQALRKIGAIEALPALVQLLGNDPFFGARAEAAEAIGVLVHGFPDDYRSVQAQAVLNEYEAKEKQRQEENSRRVLRELFVALDGDAREIADVAAELQQELATQLQEANVNRARLKWALEKAEIIEARMNSVAKMVEPVKPSF
ncbi:MAG TPA: HEAT repeat domain-containing protein [Candidatus Kapabacteria bacterium]|nr:HEAT repeat domain-containing protein [Candidatus Kapabacteria bacterium]